MKRTIVVDPDEADALRGLLQPLHYIRDDARASALADRVLDQLYPGKRVLSPNLTLVVTPAQRALLLDRLYGLFADDKLDLSTEEDRETYAHAVQVLLRMGESPADLIPEMVMSVAAATYTAGVAYGRANPRAVVSLAL